MVYYSRADKSRTVWTKARAEHSRKKRKFVFINDFFFLTRAFHAIRYNIIIYFTTLYDLCL